MIRNIVGVFDKKEKTGMIEDFENPNTFGDGKKVYSLILEDVIGDPYLSLEVINSALRYKIKIDAEGKGTLGISAALLLVLAKQTGGKSSVFFTTEFDMSYKSGEKIDPKKNSIKVDNLLKAFKHLKCNEKLLKQYLENGEVITAQTAKKIGIISEIDDLPLLTPKKPRKKKEEQKEPLKDENPETGTTAETGEKEIINEKKDAKDKTEVNSASADSTVKNSSQAETNSDNTDAVNEPKDEKGSDNEVKKKK